MIIALIFAIIVAAVAIGILFAGYYVIREQASTIDTLESDKRSLIEAVSRKAGTPVFFRETLTLEPSEGYWEGKPQIEQITVG